MPGEEVGAGLHRRLGPARDPYQAAPGTVGISTGAWVRRHDWLRKRVL